MFAIIRQPLGYEALPWGYARRSMALADVAVRQAKPAAKQYKLADGVGLYLLVTPAGGKLWRFNSRVDAKRAHSPHRAAHYSNEITPSTARHSVGRIMTSWEIRTEWSAASISRRQ